jgi:hypothetical protein
MASPFPLKNEIFSSKTWDRQSFAPISSGRAVLKPGWASEMQPRLGLDGDL